MTATTPFPTSPDAFKDSDQAHLAVPDAAGNNKVRPLAYIITYVGITPEVDIR